MALIKCPECGKEISDTVKKCPNCGYRKKTKFNNKVFIAGGAIIALALIVGVVFMYFTREQPLTKLEQQAVDCIIDYKKMLKNPESLQVHDIRWEENKAVENMIFIYADVSGQNGFGGNTRDIIRYGVEENSITFQGSSDDDDNSWEELVARKIKEGWNKLSKDDNSIIDVERVMSKVNGK